MAVLRQGHSSPQSAPASHDAYMVLIVFVFSVENTKDNEIALKRLLFNNDTLWFVF
jgi:hypothetical protein